MKLLDVKTDPSAVFRRTFLLEFPFMVTMVSAVSPKREDVMSI